MRESRDPMRWTIAHVARYAAQLKRIATELTMPKAATEAVKTCV